MKNKKIKNRRTKNNIKPRPHLVKPQENQDTNLQGDKYKDHRWQRRRKGKLYSKTDAKPQTISINRIRKQNKTKVSKKR